MEHKKPWTKEPWTISGEFVYGEISADGSGVIAECRYNRNPVETQEEVFANATIMGTAPELYETLFRVYIELEEYNKSDSCKFWFSDEVMNKIRLVLRKANRLSEPEDTECLV
jgi:hypothetical protein